MVRRNTRIPSVVALAALALTACSQDAVTPPSAAPRDLEPSLSVSGEAGSGAIAEAMRAMIDEANAALNAHGADYRIALAEYITSVDGKEAGGTVLSKVVGNKQLTHDFVPFDPRRAVWSGLASGTTDDITFAIDQVDAVPTGGVVTGSQATEAIRRAMASWEGVRCSSLPLTEQSFAGDIGVAAGLSGPVADVMHAGWGDVNFDVPPAPPSVLAATLTFVFIQPNPNPPPANVPTDIDGNGKADVAFREIYYDPSWIWRINGNIDIESVALHEAGHGLSQAHFGKVWLKNDGSLKASPRAVMNALYAGPFQRLAGTDNGGHCSNWASWPNN